MQPKEPLFQCPKCGGSRLKIPASPESVSDNEIMKCDACGAEIGTWRELRAKAMKMAATHVLKSLAEKGIPARVQQLYDDDEGNDK